MCSVTMIFTWERGCCFSRRLPGCVVMLTHFALSFFLFADWCSWRVSVPTAAAYILGHGLGMARAQFVSRLPMAHPCCKIYVCTP